jgi:hypothetical protein
VHRHKSNRAGTIDDSSQGLDSPRLDAPPSRSPLADAPLGPALSTRLILENLALRQTLATLARRRHPDIRPVDRAFWVLLRRFWSHWAEALAIVRPDTVVRWHRAGSRVYWDCLSRRGARSGRPLPREVRALIRKMASENPWGAPRIHGKLLRLGFHASQRSVSRYLTSLPRAPRAKATWTTFLRNHRDGIAAMDFFTVLTPCFASFMCFSSSATADATWSAAPSPPVRLLPGSRSNFARPSPSSWRRAS